MAAFVCTYRTIFILYLTFSHAFILENWSSIVGIAGAAHLLALAIVNVTPTPKDDELYGKFYKVIEMIAGIVTQVAKK